MDGQFYLPALEWVTYFWNYFFFCLEVLQSVGATFNCTDVTLLIMLLQKSSLSMLRSLATEQT